MAFVYALHASNEPGVIRYVGLTTQPINARLAQHKSHTDRRSAHKENWVKKVHRDGHEICCVVLEECETSVVGVREQYWIAKLKDEGCNLTNLCGGGEGHLNPSPEARRKMGASKIGKRLSPEHVAKCAASNTGKRRTEEQKDKIRQKLLGRVVSEQTKQKLRDRPVLLGMENPCFGKPKSTEHKAKLSAGRVLMYAQNPEMRKKTGDARRGKAVGEESGRAILTEVSVCEIYALSKAGVSNPDIAKKYGVSKSAIRSIVIGKNWPHIFQRENGGAACY
jgi:group I intron endonuclease